MTRYFLALLLFLFFIFNQSIFSQTKSDLEQKKQQIAFDIKKIEQLIYKSINKKKELLINVENLTFKIKLQQDLINNINNQLNLIVEEIRIKNIELNTLLSKQKKIKKTYAEMILKSYKHKSNLNKIMFIFSANNFIQAYKRLQYYKQYIKYKDDQINEIRLNAKLIDDVLESLELQKASKQNLVIENSKIKRTLDKENLMQENIIKEIKKDEKRYSNQIKTKQKQSLEIDRKIEKLIAEATAKTNNKLPEFKLTEEAKLISKKFYENKGKLPWPVDKGLVILRYGRQAHPIVKTTTIQSNGVRILTRENQEVRSIFDGKVYSIIVSKNGSHAVLIQHGNFFSVYKNLSEIFVKKGDVLATKQRIGKLGKNKSSGQTILNFSIFNNGVTENPSSWIYKL
mgnify:CR=1 FL=1|tara:strand:+ start:524 stop:1720 length:1197 start_codon:yes stop_codon:yes gene_type:complete